MIKGEKVRLDIHNILYSIYKFNRTLNNPKILKMIDKSKIEDIPFINNVTLNSMRLQFHILKIIEKYVKKKLRINEKILLISAITQIVFLDFKEYAVINCTVEIAKKLKIFHGLINAFLKNVSNDKESLKKINISFQDLPVWFKEKNGYLSGIVERLNRKINLVTRKSYGFKSFDVLKIALFHTMGDLPEPEMTHRFC